MRLELTFSKEEMALIQKAKEILSHKTGGSLKSTVLEMASQVIKAQEPKNSPTATVAVAVKAVTPRLRREILQRDQCCCQHIDPETGRICGSKIFLEVDQMLLSSDVVDVTKALKKAILD